MDKLRILLKAQQLSRVVASQSLSTLANKMIGFVIPWLVLQRTGSALDAGSVAFFMGLTSLFGNLISGLISDRIGGRKASIISDMFSLATVIILPISLFFDFLPLWLIIVTQMLGVLFDAAGAIGKDTLVPRAARDDKVPLIRATSLQETLQGTADLIGPLAAGFLIGIFNESITLIVTSTVFFICIVLIRGVRRQHIVHSEKLTFKKALMDTREGFAYTLKDRLLRAITFFLIINTAIYLPLITIIFPAWFVLSDQGSGALGGFLAAHSLGIIIGGALFAIIATKVSAYKWFVFANIMLAITFAGYLFVEPGSIASYILSVCNGLAGAGLTPIVFAAYYARTPERLLGRVNGASGTIMGLALPLAYLAFGWLIEVTSAQNALAIVFGAFVLLAIIAIVTPAFRLFDESFKAADKTPAAQ